MSNCNTNAKCAFKICMVDILPTYPEATTLYTLRDEPFKTFYCKKECGSGFDSFELGSGDCPPADCIVLTSDITIAGTTYIAGEINVQDILALLAGLNHDPVTVGTSTTIDFTLLGQALTGEIAGVSTATVGQLPVADGAGNIIWTTPTPGTISVVTDNGDGTYSHSDGNGNTIVIDTNATSNYISSDITIGGVTYVAGTNTVQEVLDALTAANCEDPQFTINAGTTATSTDNSLGEEAVDCGDVVHFWSSDDSIDFNVTAGSAVIDIIVKAVSAAIVTYDNTASGLTATNTQVAVDELAADSHADDDVETVTGTAVDNTDPRNPVIDLEITTGTGAPTGTTPISPLVYVDDATGDIYTYDGTTWNLQGVDTLPAWDNPDNTPADQSSTDIKYTEGLVAINTDDFSTSPLTVETNFDNALDYQGIYIRSPYDADSRRMITFQRGATSNQRAYMDWLDHTGATTNLLGFNNLNGFVAFDSINQYHFISADSGSSTKVNSFGISPTVINYDGVPTSTGGLVVNNGSTSLNNLTLYGAIRNSGVTAFNGRNVEALSPGNTNSTRILTTAGTSYLTGSLSLGIVSGANRINFLSNGFAPRITMDTALGRLGILTTTPTEALDVVGNVTANAYLITSDIRNKYDFIESGLTKVINGNVVKVYTYKRIYDGVEELGVKAQDVLQALSNLPATTQNLIVKRGIGVDYSETLTKLNTDFNIEASTIIEAIEVISISTIEKSLKDNGLPSISIEKAMSELESLQILETLTEDQKNRLEKLKSVNFNRLDITEHQVQITDLHSINTTALSWVE